MSGPPAREPIEEIHTPGAASALFRQGWQGTAPGQFTAIPQTWAPGAGTAPAWRGPVTSGAPATQPPITPLTMPFPSPIPNTWPATFSSASGVPYRPTVASYMAPPAAFLQQPNSFVRYPSGSPPLPSGDGALVPFRSPAAAASPFYPSAYMGYNPWSSGSWTSSAYGGLYGQSPFATSFNTPSYGAVPLQSYQPYNPFAAAYASPYSPPQSFPRPQFAAPFSGHTPIPPATYHSQRRLSAKSDAAGPPLPSPRWPPTSAYTSPYATPPAFPPTSFGSPFSTTFAPASYGGAAAPSWASYGAPAGPFGPPSPFSFGAVSTSTPPPFSSYDFQSRYSRPPPPYGFTGPAAPPPVPHPTTSAPFPPPPGPPRGGPAGGPTPHPQTAALSHAGLQPGRARGPAPDSRYYDPENERRRLPSDLIPEDLENLRQPGHT
eukprot:EG_transcript_13133